MTKYFYLVLIFVLPFFSVGQSEIGGLSAGIQFNQNILQPDNYDGFGIGVNAQLDVYQGFGVIGSYFYESLNLANAGSLKRFQRGLAANYLPLYKKKWSPWVQIGAVFNTINVQPVSYLFADNSSKVITQNYFSLNLGLGGLYHVNNNLTVNTGIYFQPQNYPPNYMLTVSESIAEVQTNIVSINPQVDPLIYFNIGFTYKIAKLW
ncbi:MAG: hypothetical protein AB8B72_00470 [Crocinitomicaceae bacterium]